MSKCISCSNIFDGAQFTVFEPFLALSTSFSRSVIQIA